MDYFAGLDVSVKETSVCIVDDAGRLVREADIARGILAPDQTTFLQGGAAFYVKLWVQL